MSRLTDTDELIILRSHTTSTELSTFSPLGSFEDRVRPIAVNAAAATAAPGRVCETG